MNKFGKIISGGLHLTKNVLASTTVSCDAMATSCLLARKHNNDKTERENYLDAATSLAEISAYSSLGLLGVSAVSAIVDGVIEYSQKQEEEQKKREKECVLTEEFTKEMQAGFDRILKNIK